MSYEMSCAHCEGRLMVEELGIVVACPHCGTHLAIPAEIPGLSLTPSSPEPEEDSAEGESPGSKLTWRPETEGEESSSSISEISTSAAHQTGASDSNILVSEPELQTGSEIPSAVRVLNPDPSTVMPAIVTDVKVSEPISSFPMVGGADPGEAVSSPGIMAGAFAKGDAAETSVPPQPVKVDRKESPKQSVYEAVYSSRRGKLVPNPVFQAWLSYTILLTAGLAMAIYYIFTNPISVLESLPDVKPAEKSGNVFRKLVPERAAMPWGHTLSFNQTQRFGNIEVTPLKVTKGDLILSGRSYVEDSQKTQNAGTVLKLWLRFKNVSQDQTIAPLDNELLFYRDPRSDRKAGALANNFVCRASEKSEQGDLILVYDHWTEGDYDIEDANIGTELSPGEEVTIFIPSEPEGLSQLAGPLVWRVHIRKGYSPQNYGVTTVFEVEFDSDAIEPESASA